MTMTECDFKIGIPVMTDEGDVGRSALVILTVTPVESLADRTGSV
jgi:hypothetical protein